MYNSKCTDIMKPTIYIKSSFNFEYTKSVKYFIPSLLLFMEKICPLIENMRSTAAEEAGTLKYFLASLANDGYIIS